MPGATAQKIVTAELKFNGDNFSRTKNCKMWIVLSGKLTLITKNCSFTPDRAIHSVVDVSNICIVRVNMHVNFNHGVDKTKNCYNSTIRYWSMPSSGMHNVQALNFKALGLKV